MIEREGLRLLAESVPDGRTPMSGGTDARGDLGAVAEASRKGTRPFGSSQIIALPQHRRSTNRELAARRCAPNRQKRADGTRGEGGA